MPMSDVKPPRWLQISEAAQALVHTLLERYPAAFSADPAGVRPLKIRIDRDIRQALGVPRQVISDALARSRQTKGHSEGAKHRLAGCRGNVAERRAGKQWRKVEPHHMRALRQTLPQLRADAC